MGKIIGIDLGTTNSSVAVIEGGTPQIIANKMGQRLTPSVVRVVSENDILVGEHALRSRLLYPQNTVTGIKRFIGRRYNEVIDIAESVPYDVVIGQYDLAAIKIGDEHYSPQRISAFILRSLKESAEDYLGCEVNKAVITVPAYFNENQREATREAGRIAGLEVMRIVAEPTAAALAFGLNVKRDEMIAVFDLGGGTFDISILEIGEGVVEVLAISGDGFLGGDDFDEKIVDWVVEEVAFETGIDVRDNVEIMQRIRVISTEIKHTLSSMPECEINLPFLIKMEEGYYSFDSVLTRTKFEQICEELFERLIPPCEEVLSQVSRLRDPINRVLLVGGGTRIPKIAEVVEKIFNKIPNKSINPDEAVTLGAATQAGVLGGDKTDILLLDVAPRSLGIEVSNGKFSMMISANTTIPTRKSELFSTMTDDQTTIEIHVLEGESSLAVNNLTLGRFALEGIRPEKRGYPQIEITFDVDANSIVIVTAQEMSTGKSQQIRVKAFSEIDMSDVLIADQNISISYISDDIKNDD